MSVPRNVPGIARGPQSFSRSALPPIQSPMPNPAREYSAEQFQPVDQDAQDLAMEIYSRLAIDLIRSSQTANEELLKQMANHAQTAAKIYFEGAGGAK